MIGTQLELHQTKKWMVLLVSIVEIALKIGIFLNKVMCGPDACFSMHSNKFFKSHIRIQIFLDILK